MHQYQDLIRLFNQCFSEPYNTKLVKGDDEPLYRPADADQPYHAIYFAHGYFSSALHECAHWLIAGDERRKLLDFGYWYTPDGRTAEEQALFQQVEVKPQAMECILSVATKHPFHISVDNLNGKPCDTAPFIEAVYQQIKIYCEQGLTARASSFRQALCNFYNTPNLLQFNDFITFCDRKKIVSSHDPV